MNPLHLSDEAVAAFADGVLRGHARERAARHTDACPECRQAVRSQREAVLALRSAPAPALPGGLFERLQALPDTTSMPVLPAVFAVQDDRSRPSPFAQLSAFVPAQPAPRSGRHVKPLATGVAVLALAAGTLAAAAVPRDTTPVRGEGTVTTRVGNADHARQVPGTSTFVGIRFVRR